jgi:hypothetical protein
MPCVGRLRAEQEKQPDQNRCSHELSNVGIRLLSPSRCLLFRQSGSTPPKGGRALVRGMPKTAHRDVLLGSDPGHIGRPATLAT